MDPLTAKTLVSALLVFGIVAFSLVSLQHALTEMLGDLRAARRAAIPVRARSRNRPTRD
ncbi:hypothetical protein [Methylobacterium nigriterrae]|uniref:hypothetical protein n=1 Tax=Methylobacterium nigriterrae TaxID=3127512 RepID=UPI00301412CC